MAPLLVLGMVEFVRGALIFSLLPMFGRFQIGYGLGVVGAAISIHYLLDNLLRIPAGWLSDRFGGKWLMAGGIVLSALGLFLLFVHWTQTWFLIGAGVFGLGTAPLWPTVIAGVAAKMSLNHLGEALSKVFVAWLVGAGLGPVIINFVIGVSFLTAFIALAAVLAIALLLAIIGKFPRIPPKAGMKEFFQELWQEFLSLWMLYPGMFVQTMSIGILMPILAVYARTVFGFSAGQFSYLLMGAGAFTVLLLIPAGKLADRIGVKGPLIGGFIVAAICLALLPLQANVIRALVAGAFIGIAYSFILPAWNGLQARVVSPEKRGTMWAVFMTIEGIGTATGAYVGGIAWEKINHQAPFFVSAFVLLAMAVFYSVINMNKLIKAE